MLEMPAQVSGSVRLSFVCSERYHSSWTVFQSTRAADVWTRKCFLYGGARESNRSSIPSSSSTSIQHRHQLGFRWHQTQLCPRLRPLPECSAACSFNPDGLRLGDRQDGLTSRGTMLLGLSSVSLTPLV